MLSSAASFYSPNIAGHQSEQHSRQQKIADFFVIVGMDALGLHDVEYLTDTYNEQSNETHRRRASEPSPGPGSEVRSLSRSFEAKVLDQYPPAPRKSSGDSVASLTAFTSPSAELPQGIEYFCFPLGLTVQDSPIPPRLHSFIHTSEDGSRMVGCALIFSEPLTETQRESCIAEGIIVEETSPMFVKKAICLLSHWPFITSFKKYLTGLYRISLKKGTVPIERYICNFIDDIPAPPPGKVDITYYLMDEEITFRCPPLNEPNAWGGFPLFPLFECLSPVNVITLLGLLLIERQVIFVSSQFSLQTLCCEAITSLLFPLRWVHAYIPILPTRLLGALSAPFPYIFGLNAEVYRRNKSLVAADAVTVFLDENRIDCGALGPPPPFPERRYKKLFLQVTQSIPWASKSGDGVYESRWEELHRLRLPLFDDAFTDTADVPMDISGDQSNTLQRCYVDDASIREAFLKFFVSMLLSYKAYLIYPDVNEERDGFTPNFRFNQFVNDQNADWQPLLKEIVKTQAFTQFVDDRLEVDQLDRDIIFFDESIEAKLNRYTFKRRTIDTPFLLHERDKHIKTYVPPTPLIADLDQRTEYCYPTFPTLNRELFVRPRNLGPKFLQASDQVLGLLCRVRMKRKILGSHRNERLSAAGCIYSSYIIISSLFVSVAVQNMARSRGRSVTISTNQLMNEFGMEVLQQGRGHSSSVSSTRQAGYTMKDSSYYYTREKIMESSMMTLKVAFEALNVLIRMNKAPDEVVYRCIAQACADAKVPRRLVLPLIASEST